MLLLLSDLTSLLLRSLLFIFYNDFSTIVSSYSCVYMKSNSFIFFLGQDPPSDELEITEYTWESTNFFINGFFFIVAFLSSVFSNTFLLIYVLQ